MLIADTSAWIAFLSAAGSAAAQRMRQAISEQEVITLDPILLEVMAGARRGVIAQTQRLLESQEHRALSPKLDWLDAATIYRELRWRGITIRSQTDALIAAVAIRINVPVLHHDRDYDRIAEHTSLQLVEI